MMKWIVRSGCAFLLAALFVTVAAARLPDSAGTQGAPAKGGQVEFLFVDPEGTPQPDVRLCLDWEGVSLEGLRAGQTPSMPDPVEVGADGKVLFDLSGTGPGFHSILIFLEDGAPSKPSDGRKVLNSRLYFYDPGGLQRRTVGRRQKAFSLAAWMAEEGGPLAGPGPFTAEPFDSGNPMHLAAQEAPVTATETATLRITDPEGKPVRGLSCRINHQTAAFTTDGSGECTIPMRKGFPQVVTLLNGYERAVPDEIDRLVTLYSGDEIALVWEGPLPRNSYETSRGRIELTVLDHRGEPAANVLAALFLQGQGDQMAGLPAAWSYTDSEGRFIWCDVTAGDYSIEAGGIRRSLRYTGGVQLVTVQQEPPQEKGAIRQDGLFIERHDEDIGSLSVIENAGEAGLRFDLLLRVTDPQGKPVPELGCTFLFPMRAGFWNSR